MTKYFSSIAHAEGFSAPDWSRLQAKDLTLAQHEADFIYIDAEAAATIRVGTAYDDVFVICAQREVGEESEWITLAFEEGND